MNQNRRRKKRPSYGVRTIEISRGRHGFGFTISGQLPCILSCIVNGSPAEQAGLRTGDYLIAVNGRNVSKALHDDVVRMIGSCNGLLKIQIAENYYSNSSDEDSTPTAKPRPKYPHRFKQKQHIPVSVTIPFRELCPTPSRSQQQHKVTRIADNHDYKNIGDVPIETYRGEEPPKIRFGHYHHHPCKYTDMTSTPCPSVGEKRLDRFDRKQNALSKKGVETSTNWDGSLEKENHRPMFSEKEINSIVYPSLQQLQCGSECEDPIFKAVVGYLGTIEMPKEPQLAGRSLSAIRNCIRRLRVEKKVHTLVFLKVFGHCVTLTNAHGANLAEYPTATIAFCGAYADDKRFFGLVTTRAESVDDAATCSNSCHVFMVDPKLVRHEEHLKRARSFRIECTPDLGVGSTECCEFPDSVDPILVAIVGLYRSRGGVPMDLDVNVSPQPSNTSSNSDSGIGFRDEGQNSDRVSMVDVEAADYGGLVSASNICGDSWWGRPQMGFRSTVLRAKRDQQSSGKLTVRAMPDPVGFSQGETSFNTERLDAQQDPSVVRKSVQKYLQRRHERPSLSDSSKDQADTASKLAPRAMSPVLVSLRPISPDALLLKLSPKVFHDNNGTACVIKSRSVADLAQDNQDSDGATTVNDGVTESTCEQEGSQDVHPPSQEEDLDSSDYENDDGSQADGCRWSRAGSFKKRFQTRFGQSKSNEDATFSDGELVNGKVSTSSSMMALDNASEAGSSGQCSSMVDVGRVGSWAVSFEKLLADPAGLHTFAEFLKKEFSYENIMFWVACERYRRLTDKTLIKEHAKEIFERHLGLGASEPVNVDSHARQVAQDELSHPDHNIFAQAQKQIFNLMKFDCYSRFLKSPIYCDCMLKEVAKKSLPYLGSDELDPEIPRPGAVAITNGKKSKDKKEDGEDRRRKSLLPWHRTKSGKLKKKKEKKEDAFMSSWSDVTGSRSSLASSDVPPFQKQLSTKAGSMSGSDQQDSTNLCRIHLPDHSTTVLPVKSGESVAEWTRQLLERRGLQYTTTDVYLSSSNKAVEPDTDSVLLGGREIQIEGRIALHVELPNKQVIDVNAKSDSTLSNVLRPALQKHGFKMDSVVVIGAKGQIDVDEPASVAASRILTVVPNSKVNDSSLHDFKQQTAFNELTSKVFDNLLNARKKSRDEEGSCDSACGYFRATSCPMKPPMIASRPPRHRRKNSDEMYDLWKKAQCSRLDDQRGTEINFELPEFLKAHPGEGNGGGRCRILDGRASEPIPVARTSKSRSSRFSSSEFFGLKPAGSEDSLLADGVIPTHEQAEEYFSAHPQSYGCRAEKRTLQDFGLSHLSSNKGMTRPPINRPCSHPPPKAPVLWRRSASVPVCDYSNRESLAALSPVKEAPASTTFAQNRTLSPSSIPHPSVMETSIHGEVADYPPPSPLDHPSSDKPFPPQIPLRLSAIDPPPPLPPKPRFQTRRPVPPAPPQLTEPRVIGVNSDEENQKKNYCCKSSEVVAMDRGVKLRLKDAFRSDKFSISFV